MTQVRIGLFQHSLSRDPAKRSGFIGIEQQSNELRS